MKADSEEKFEHHEIKIGPMIFNCVCIKEDCEWFIHGACRISSGLRQIQNQFYYTLSEILPQQTWWELTIGRHIEYENDSY